MAAALMDVHENARGAVFRLGMESGCMAVV